MKRTSLAIFAALVCTSAPFAIGQASAQQAGGSSASDQLDGFIGDGTCTGSMMAMGKTPAHATTGKYHGEKTLDGNWVVIHYDEDQTAANPKPFSVVQYIGYDAGKKHFVGVAFDNTGAPYSTGTSTGWKGGAFTLDESVPMAGGKHIAFRDIFTNGDSGMSSHTGMLQDKSGKWVKTDEETCHKA
ncbi:MAG: DUF1579 family protein [Pseudomonadota bacterium]